jgi:AcrR family transcriptional regulator
MKEAAPTRPYRQRRRAEAAEARTAAIREAALAAFMAKPFDQITLADVAEQAGVGVQTLIRRVQTKDGLVRAVREWIAAQIEEARGEPVSDPDALAAALLRLAGEPRLRASLGAKAREEIATNRTWDAVGARFVEVYDRVLPKHS